MTQQHLFFRGGSIRITKYIEQQVDAMFDAMFDAIRFLSGSSR